MSSQIITITSVETLTALRLFRSCASHLQNELRKAALERAGGGSRKAVLPPKDPKESSEPRVVDIDHLTRTQVMAGHMLYWQILLGLRSCVTDQECLCLQKERCPGFPRLLLA